MPRYKLTIAYDGSDFCGWQRQEPPVGQSVGSAKVLAEAAGGAAGPGADTGSPPGPGAPDRLKLRTVQEVIQRAVREVVREPVEVLGASRTDSGVHARGQVAAFTCGGDDRTEQTSSTLGSPDRPGPSFPGHPVTHSPSHPLTPSPSRSGWPLARGTDRLVMALNSRLPDDALVIAAEPVAPTFDPIGDCTAKGYSYTLYLGAQRPVFERRYVHHVWRPLDVAAMRSAAGRFIGEHDFAGFAAAGHGRLTTVRTIFDCRVVEAGDDSSTPRLVRIEVSGSGFLYNMVRIIAGTLLDVGLGKKSPEEVTRAIESRDRRNAGPTLPPGGLCLEWVRYA